MLIKNLIKKLKELVKVNPNLVIILDGNSLIASPSGWLYDERNEVIAKLNWACLSSFLFLGLLWEKRGGLK